ncbi:hypothetical protein JCM8547_004734 [Rhodosporidiobolus lusitaniae]
MLSRKHSPSRSSPLQQVQHVDEPPPPPPPPFFLTRQAHENGPYIVGKDDGPEHAIREHLRHDSTTWNMLEAHPSFAHTDSLPVPSECLGRTSFSSIFRPSSRSSAVSLSGTTRSRTPSNPLTASPPSPLLVVTLYAFFRPSEQHPGAELKDVQLHFDQPHCSVRVVFQHSQLISYADAPRPKPRVPLLEVGVRHLTSRADGLWRVEPEPFMVNEYDERAEVWAPHRLEHLRCGQERHRTTLGELQDALETIQGLLHDYITAQLGGHSAFSPAPRSFRGHSWVNELRELRKEIAELESIDDLTFVDGFGDVRPLHFVGQLAWAWTGASYCLFEVVASGVELVELKVLHHDARDQLDFSSLAGLPVYTNTPLHVYASTAPRRDSQSSSSSDPLHPPQPRAVPFDFPPSPPEFHLLGTIQGGCTSIAFVTPYAFLYASVKASLRRIVQEKEGPAAASSLWSLEPRLPPVGEAKLVKKVVGEAGEGGRKAARKMRERVKTGFRPRRGSTEGPAG